LGIVGIYLHARQIIPEGSCDIIRLASPKIAAGLAGTMGGATSTTSKTIFLLLMVGFLVRLAVFPFHSWLLDTHAQSSTATNMVLATLLLNLGGYGILRVAYPLFPETAKTLWLVFAGLGLFDLIYTALCAMAQTDLKRLVTCSTLGQVSLILIGTSMMTPAGINGCLFLMIGHGITCAMLFYIIGTLQDRLPNRNLTQLAGLAKVMPGCTGFSLVAFAASMGLPGLCGFIGPLLVILGTFQASRADSPLYQHAHSIGCLNSYLICIRILAITACTSTVLTAKYMLRAVQRIHFGQLSSELPPLPDLTPPELAVLLPLTILTILLGLSPVFFIFTLSNPTIAGLLRLF
jgi:NADH-quinone oxidoreductase subunit M